MVFPGFPRAAVADIENGIDLPRQIHGLGENDLHSPEEEGENSFATTNPFVSQSAQTFEDACRRFAASLCGTPPPTERNLSSSTVNLLVARLDQIRTTSYRNRILGTLDPSFLSRQTEDVRIVGFLTEVASILRKSPGVSLASAVAALVSASTLVENPHTMETENECIACLFAAVGWITMLYEPSSISVEGNLTIEASTTANFLVAHVSRHMAQRPIAEMIRQFGDVLPTRAAAENSPDLFQFAAPETSPGALHVANLNISTLNKVGELHIEWVDTISNHLELDTTRGVLKLFRSPSLLLLYEAQDSCLSRVLENFYDEMERPRNFTVGNFCREIYFSYELLVYHDASARRAWRHFRKGTKINGCRDSLLDKLCLGEHRRSSPWWRSRKKKQMRDSFDAASDFPILSTRLLRLQRYINGIQPNRIYSLWRDKRDILRWYTFWAVLLIGGANLAVAVIQMVLSGAQLKVSQQALVQGFGPSISHQNCSIPSMKIAICSVKETAQAPNAKEKRKFGRHLC